MSLNLRPVSSQLDVLGEVGRALVADCEGALFPCDAIALSVLLRAAQLCRSFELLMNGGQYAVAVSLTRQQLDNLLRFTGIVSTRYPHNTANVVANGRRLDQIKGRDGQPMSDKNLRQSLEKSYPWVHDIYEKSSGQLHLSKDHISHMLGQSSIGEDGIRLLAMTERDDYIPIRHKESLVETFAKITALVVAAVGEWVSERRAHGGPDELKTIFKEKV